MKHSIYGLYDVSKPELICYVGRTSSIPVRFARHFSGKDKVTMVWVNSVKQAGSTIAIKILETTDEFNSGEVEAQWIRKLKSEELLNTKSLPPAFEFKVSPITSLVDLELQYIRHALEMFGGNKQATAKALGIGRQTLYNKLELQETLQHA
jgi:DNA-binding NtrC family response regulator